MSELRLVAERAELVSLVERLAGAAELALDTEFVWERTYRPLLAVVQVGARLPTGQVVVAAVDALALDLGPLLELLAEPGRGKLLHAGRLDLAILHRLLGRPLSPVFDTQRAAALVGFGGQIGYGALVEQLTGRRLEKGEQWSDWTRRPLRPEQLSYALDDVRHLPDVAAALRGLLDQSGRAAWAAEEMQDLHDPSSWADPAPGEEWLKVKAARTLPPRAQAVLREVCVWREESARARDLRPGFVVKDQVLLELARRPPRSLDALREVRGLHPGEVKRGGAELLAALRRGERAEPPPQPPRKRRMDVSGAVDLLKAWLGQKAAAEGVASEVLATTAELTSLASSHARGDPPPGLPVLSGWRRQLVGEDLLRLLRGEVALQVQPRARGLRAVPPDAAPDGAASGDELEEELEPESEPDDQPEDEGDPGE